MGTLRMRDLIKVPGVTHRIVRQYIQRGLLPHATGRGTGPVYSEDHLVRLRAIRRLLAERLSLDDIKRRLARLTPEELAQLGAAPLVASTGTASATATVPPSPAREVSSDGGFQGAERWERVVLLPGLELHVRSDAGALVRRLAGEIHARYSVAAAG